MSALDFNANIVIFLRYPIFPISYFERPPMLYIIEYMNLCFTQKFLMIWIVKN